MKRAARFPHGFKAFRDWGKNLSQIHERFESVGWPLELGEGSRFSCGSREGKNL